MFAFRGGEYPLRVRRALLLSLLLCPGCGPANRKVRIPGDRGPLAAAPLDPWVLTTLNGRDPEPAYLSNGLIGVRIGRNASGLGPDGKPLGFYMIDEYEGTGEEKIRPLPNPLLVTLAVGNATLPGGRRLRLSEKRGHAARPARRDGVPAGARYARRDAHDVLEAGGSGGELHHRSASDDAGARPAMGR